MRIVDVLHLGRERVIGCWVADGLLVDPGPESTLETLLDGLGDEEPRAVLLTHIHFDHAGATGAILRRWPDLPVYVHRSGARHLVAPERLVSSAGRLYGEGNMQRLWGEVVPVPEANLHPLDGGETILDGVRVAYTPGHASHHVSYLHEPTGMAWVGDVAGVRIPPSDLVVAPTPPPDVDIAAWRDSLDLLAGWRPSALGLTHFGRVDDVTAQLDALRAALDEEAELARTLELEDFVERMRARIAAAADPATAEAFLQAAPPEHLHLGLGRWWSKHGSPE